MVGVSGVFDDVALLRQCLCATSWMDGREVLMMFSAVLTTLCSDFLSEALELPNQMEMQLVSSSLWCLCRRWSGWEGTAVLSSSVAGSADIAAPV